MGRCFGLGGVWGCGKSSLFLLLGVVEINYMETPMLPSPPCAPSSVPPAWAAGHSADPGKRGVNMGPGLLCWRVSGARGLCWRSALGWVLRGGGKGPCPVSPVRARCRVGPGWVLRALEGRRSRVDTDANGGRSRVGPCPGGVLGGCRCRFCVVPGPGWVPVRVPVGGRGRAVAGGGVARGRSRLRPCGGRGERETPSPAT